MVTIYQYPPLFVYCVSVAAVLGAATGSFLNCAAWRIVRGESFVKGRSRCPSCGHTLGFDDLIPVLSWLLLRGRCQYCGEKIPPRYVLSELFFAALTVACLLRFDLTVLCLRNWIFLCCLFCLSLADWESSEIPDGCLIAAALAWLAALPLLWDDWHSALLHVLSGVVYGGGLLALSLVMDRVLKKESLGGGDVKLFAVVGLYLGFVGTLFALILSCVLGLLLAAVLRRGRGKAFPFGPAVAAAAAAMLLYGEPLVNWYLRLLARA